MSEQSAPISFNVPVEPVEPQSVKYVPFPVAGRREMLETLLQTTNDPKTVEQVIGTLATQDREARQDKVNSYKALARTEDELLITQLEKERLAEEGRIDALTGLFNRRHFEGLVKEAISEGKSFSIILLDLDGFKALNDTKGHDAGDSVLRATGRLLSDNKSLILRKGDFAGRLGGDEILIYLENDYSENGDREERTTEEARSGLIDRLNKTVQEQADIAIGGNANISISAGYADHIPGESYEELIRRVDDLMYDAKTSKKAYNELVDISERGKLPKSVFAELKSRGSVMFRGMEWQLFDTQKLQSRIDHYFTGELQDREGTVATHDQPLTKDVERFNNVFKRFGKEHPGVWGRLKYLAIKEHNFKTKQREPGANPDTELQEEFNRWTGGTRLEKEILLNVSYGFLSRLVFQNQAMYPEEKLMPTDLVN